MLTLRFESRNPPYRYVVYGCERYIVQEEHADADSYHRVVRMFKYHADEENPYYQTVGANEPYGVCYVMNDAGKTIDTIR